MFKVVAMFNDLFHFFHGKDIGEFVLFFWPIQLLVFLFSSQHLFIVEFNGIDSLVLLGGRDAFGTDQTQDIIIDVLGVD